jgi:hypothetical protein
MWSFVVSYVFISILPVYAQTGMMNDIKSNWQFDPLDTVFSINHTQSVDIDKMKIKYQQMMIKEGHSLEDKCLSVGESRYHSTYQKDLALRSYISTLQYVGIEKIIKTIASLSRKLNIEKDEYKNLTTELVSKNCSPNISIMGHKLINAYFLKSYDENNELFKLNNSNYFSAEIKAKSEEDKYFEKSMYMAIKNFRSFCSWGGNVNDLRMLTPFLGNPTIASFINTHLSGKYYSFNTQKNSVDKTFDPEKSTQVHCQDLICRKTTFVDFRQKFPRMVGSQTLENELDRLYCQYFAGKSYPKKEDTNRSVFHWIKEQTLEEEKLEVSFFQSMFTELPEMMLLANTFEELKPLIASQFKENWNKWAQVSSDTFSHKLYFEETLKVSYMENKSKKLELNFLMSLGELDKVFTVEDKISTEMHLKLSQGYLYWIKSSWKDGLRSSDPQKNIALIKQVAQYLGAQLKTKESKFKMNFWGEGFENELAKHLVSNVLTQEYSMDKLKPEAIVKIPVKFEFGLFALTFLRYKAQVEKVKLEL